MACFFDVITSVCALVVQLNLFETDQWVWPGNLFEPAVAAASSKSRAIILHQVHV